MLLQKHMNNDHYKIEKLPVIKCTICEFKTESQVQFMVHMESHHESIKKTSSETICKWFLQGRCSFGDRCWNSHSSSSSSVPPQCKFKSRCGAWPYCRYGHYEVCENFHECRNKTCSLAHPFLSKTQTNLPPDLNSFTNFPNLQRTK